MDTSIVTIKYGSKMSMKGWSIQSARTPSPKQKVTLRLDRDVVAFFKQGGKGFQARINQVLRAYMEAQQRR